MNHRYLYTNCYNVAFKDKVTLTLHKEKPADSGLVVLYFVITGLAMVGLEPSVVGRYFSRKKRLTLDIACLLVVI